MYQLAEMYPIYIYLQVISALLRKGDSDVCDNILGVFAFNWGERVNI